MVIVALRLMSWQFAAVARASRYRETRLNARFSSEYLGEGSEAGGEPGKMEEFEGAAVLSRLSRPAPRRDATRRAGLNHRVMAGTIMQAFRKVLR